MIREALLLVKLLEEKRTGYRQNAWWSMSWQHVQLVQSVVAHCASSTHAVGTKGASSIPSVAISFLRQQNIAEGGCVGGVKT